MVRHQYHSWKLRLKFGGLPTTLQNQWLHNRQTTLGGFQTSSNLRTSKDFRSILKAYIKPSLLIVRHHKIFNSDSERKETYPSERKENDLKMLEENTSRFENQLNVLIDTLE